jgi:hypothetical protein
VGRGLATGTSFVHGILLTAYRIKKVTKRNMHNKLAIEILIILPRTEGWCD